ncbi:MAG: hypothetical protein WC693_06045 [Patescibacteria group bacterium]|jgi:hypothetical protein
MKSIDAVKKAPVKAGKKKSSKKKNVFQSAVDKKKVKGSPVGKEAKHSLMWIMVSCFMVVVVVGWVFFLRSSLTDDLSKRGGGFDEIAKGFSRLFHTVDRKFEGVQDAFVNLQKVQENLIEEDGTADEVQALREKVFPQFENINTNSNI